MTPEYTAAGNGIQKEIKDFVGQLELERLTPENVKDLYDAASSPPFKSMLVRGLPYYNLVWLEQVETVGDEFLIMNYRFDCKRRPDGGGLTLPYSPNLSATNFSLITPSDGFYNGFYVNAEACRELLVLTIPFCRDNLPQLYGSLNIDAK